jgi:sensor histidine kinase YesM
VLVMVILGVLYGTQGEVQEAKIEETFEIILFFALFPSAISFYSFYFFLFPRFLQQKRILKAILYGLLISFLSGVIGYLVLLTLYGATCTADEGENAFIGVILFISFVALINGVIGLVIKGFITWFDEIKLKEMLKQKNHETELALVKSQLDPHFLFNTINNIDVLIIKNANEASDYLNKLSDIMRFMLFETKTDEIPLAKELEYIKKYIALQKIRTANLNYVTLEIEGDAEGKTIAPMLFIPFIENAFKHTTNKKLEQAITISISISNSEVKMSCINKIDLNRKLQQESNGLGNTLIKKRLELLYPERHTLELIHEKERYSVYLTIQNGTT